MMKKIVPQWLVIKWEIGFSVMPSIFRIFIIVFVSSLCCGERAHADFILPAASSVGCDTTNGVMQIISNVCLPTQNTNLYTAGQKFDQSYSYVQFAGETAYPPTGVYLVRVYFCQLIDSNTPGICSEKNAYNHADSINRLTYSGGMETTKGLGSFGELAVPYTLQQTSSVCLSLVNTVSGIEYVLGDAGIWCQDAKPLPTTKATCSINDDATLYVAFDEIDRKNIPTEPTPSAQYNVKKSFTVNCNGGGDIIAYAQFKYTPISIGTNEVLATSNKSLGVAIMSYGKVVAPSDNLYYDFQFGLNTVTLEFELLHPADVETNDIATGDFSGSAVMVMTLH